MKNLIVAAVVAAFFVSTAAEAKGGRGGFGGRSFSRPAPTKHYAPKPTKRTTIVKKNTTVINQTVNTAPASSSGSSFWSSVAGSAVGSLGGSMAGNALYDAMSNDKPAEETQPAQPAQPQVIYVPVDSSGKPIAQDLPKQ